MLPLLALCLLLCPLLTWGQTYFNERYPHNGVTSSFTAITPSDSGFVLAGQTRPNPNQPRLDLLIRFLDPLGQLVRSRSYGQDGFTYFPSWCGGLVPVQGGGYAMAASRGDSANKVSVLWRFNALGDTLWTRTFRRPNNRWLILYSCKQLPNGDFILGGGERLNMATAATDAVLIRTDSLGNVRWERSYNVGYTDVTYDVQLTTDGGFLLGGYSYATQQRVQNDGLLIKVDSAGTQQWFSLLGGPYSGEGAFGIPTRDGGYLAVGGRTTAVVAMFEETRPVFYKLDGEGNLVWQRMYGPARFGTYLFRVHELADGSFIAAGQQAQSRSNNSQEGILVKICADGDSLWYRSYRKLQGAGSSDYLRDLLPTADGGFVGAGFLHALPPDPGTHDGWLFKVDSAGYLQAGGAPVTVQCRPTGVKDEAVTDELEVWPNPSVDGRFYLRVSLNAGLQVLDALGRLVWKGQAPAGEATVDLAAQPPGIYMLRITEQSGHIQTHRLLR